MPIPADDPAWRGEVGADGAAAQALVLAPDLDSIDSDTDPVHDVLKRTDVWFSYQASAVEKEAADLAERHARVGQPRHDLERDGPLEMELLLEQQAKEALWGWADRVKRKMQGAVGGETEKVGDGLAAARQAVGNAAAAREAIGRHLRSTDVRASDLRSQLETLRAKELNPGLPTEAVHVERHMGSLWFWPLMILLVMADFFANVPVFTELFPANGLLDAAFVSWEEEILSREILPTWFGVAHLLKRVAVYPESAILALSVVVFFVFLGHSFGGSLRSLVVLWRNRSVDGLHAMRSAFRQAGWPAFMALLGMGLTVFVLYEARDRVLPMATERVEIATAELTGVRGEMAALQEQGLTVTADLFTREAEAQQNLTTREQRLDYARAIGGMNFPIMLLNIVLVIAAVIAGYMREKRTFSVNAAGEAAASAAAGRRADGVQAELSAIQATLEGFRAEFVQRRQMAHDALRAVNTAILRAEHLLKADLFRDVDAKSERLRRAIPIFRSENARLRGLDVEDIVAFRTPHEMDLPGRDRLARGLEVPVALAAYRDEFASLRERLAELDQEIHPELLPIAGGARPLRPEPVLSEAV